VCGCRDALEPSEARCVRFLSTRAAPNSQFVFVSNTEAPTLTLARGDGNILVALSPQVPPSARLIRSLMACYATDVERIAAKVNNLYGELYEPADEAALRVLSPKHLSLLAAQCELDIVPGVEKPHLVQQISKVVLNGRRLRARLALRGINTKYILERSELMVTAKEHIQAQCSICAEDYTVGDPISILACGHDFHKICIGKWLCQQAEADTQPGATKDYPSCPICRLTIDKTTDRVQEAIVGFVKTCGKRKRG